MSDRPSITIRPEDLEDDHLSIRFDEFDLSEPIVITSDQLDVCVRIRSEDLPDEVTAASSSEHLRGLERRMLDLINRDRAEHGGFAAQPLGWDDEVAAVARGHSADMLARGYMAHINPDGTAPQDRLARAGIRFLACGENIAGSPTKRAASAGSDVIYTGYPTIEAAEAGLMASPGHRHNILEPRFTHVGVGIGTNTDGTLVITQNFISRSHSW
jgi:uncharacterized protein YkwD